MSAQQPYQICKRCVMDTTDPDIFFDKEGICNHCRKYDQLIETYLTPNIEQDNITPILNAIQKDGKGREYDCIIGISGGLDSSYLAYYANKMGLRPLAIHLDNGWDSELAVKNIETLLNRLTIDLDTYVIDWNAFRDLQLAFLRASTPDGEIPSDHAISSILFQKAKKYQIKWILYGNNIRTESHGVQAWSQGYNDWRYIKSVHDRFGTVPLSNYPYNAFLERFYYLIKYKRVPVLNFIPYSKERAIKDLEKEVGWRYYGEKHYESIYTRFHHGYILPTKFGYDKRKSHYSSLICSGEMTRDKALSELQKIPYSQEIMEQDKEYVTQKLGISLEEFNQIIHLPNKTIYDYPSYQRILMHPLLKKTARNYYSNLVK